MKLSYTGKGYSAGNADRIRGGQYLLTGQDNTAIYTDDYQDIFINAKNVTVEKLYELAGYRYEDMNFGRNISRVIGVKSSAECHIFQIDSGTGQLQRLLEHPALGGAVVVKMLSVLFIACQGAHPQHKLLQNRLLLRLKRRPWKRKAAITVTTTSCWLF